MGCAPVKKQLPLERKDTPIGILKATILGVHTHNGIKQAQANLKIRVSNQHFETKHLPPVVKDNTAGDTFTFAINSFYKTHGRSIQIGLFIGDTVQSYGAVDVNPLLLVKGPQDFRVILSDSKQTEHGYVLLRAVFETLPVYDITFRFETATIRRKTGTCGEDNVAVRLTIGEEVVETEFQKDSLHKPPVWKDDKYNFKVPEGVSKGFLQLLDDRNTIIGQVDLDLTNFQNVKVGDQVLQNQQLFFTQNLKQVIAADIKYTFVLGENPDFKPRTELFTSSIRAVRGKNEFNESFDKSRTN